MKNEAVAAGIPRAGITCYYYLLLSFYLRLATYIAKI